MSKLFAACILVSAALGASRATANASSDKATTVTGTVSRVTASERTVEITLPDGTAERFLWNPETKISGTLTPGAAVTVRYTAESGKKTALQITVARN
jgi:hypothetical protein